MRLERQPVEYATPQSEGRDGGVLQDTAAGEDRRILIVLYSRPLSGGREFVHNNCLKNAVF